MSSPIVRTAALLIGAAVFGGVVVFAFRSSGGHVANATKGSASSTTGSSQPAQQWWDPMLGPSSISNHPGKSAMGMDMVPIYAKAAGPQVQIDATVVQNMGVRT